MQEISKLEQPNSQNDDLMQNITKLLEKGQESAEKIRSYFIEQLGLKVEDDKQHDHHLQSDVDHHSMVTLSSIETCLSLLKSSEFDHGDLIKKRKANPTICVKHPLHVKCEETSGGRTLPKERRGSYKRRRTGQSRTVEATNLTDDGYAWRKYGQKEILYTKYPRNYYRCTHKHDQECQAKKQVQQISENPNKYTIIYNGNHTCENHLKNHTIILESPNEDSSIYLSFDTNNYTTTKHALNTPLFPSSTYHTHPPPTMVKQEHTSLKVDSPSTPHDLDHRHRTHNQYSSSSEYLPSSSDLTSTGLSSTLVSDQSDVISSAEIYSSTPVPYDNMDDDVFFSLMNMDQGQEYPLLDGLFQNYSF